MIWSTRRPSRLASCGVCAIASAAGSASAGSQPRSTPVGMMPKANCRTPGTKETSLTDRLPDDLHNTAADVHFDSVPFAPLYRIDVEFAAEMSNRTVHSVMHVAWVDQGEGCYQGQMAVYVKPRGRLGKGYMALIKPFRYWVVYPALMRPIEREWNTRVPQSRPRST